MNDRASGIVLDGILISHGDARQHIWAYATAYQKANLAPPFRNILKTTLCPCHPEFNGTVPLFIGNDYYNSTIVIAEWRVVQWLNYTIVDW